MTYKLLENGNVITGDNAIIPADERNRDYRKYLLWLAEGNTPAPVDPVDAWNAIRADRNDRLSSCDWTQLPDAALTEAERIAWAGREEV